MSSRATAPGRLAIGRPLRLSPQYRRARSGLVRCLVLQEALVMNCSTAHRSSAHFATDRLVMTARRVDLLTWAPARNVARSFAHHRVKFAGRYSAGQNAGCGGAVIFARGRCRRSNPSDGSSGVRRLLLRYSGDSRLCSPHRRPTNSSFAVRPRRRMRDVTACAAVSRMRERHRGRALRFRIASPTSTNAALVGGCQRLIRHRCRAGNSATEAIR